ncbi:AbfB domain-containing protein [Streptomyces sp. NPDC013178]|uniref:AbfB domain-containing protein n=1 Tax=Streptomyces sp. NPDC013178 TaxID=3155118 RepID=UPI0033DE3654
MAPSSSWRPGPDTERALRDVLRHHGGQAKRHLRGVPGLADGGCYSSRDSSGRHLRHKDLRIRADASNGTMLFNKDATFCAQLGSVTGSVSLESYNYPGRCIRHYYYEPRVDTYQENATFRADSSFRAATPWA